MTYTSIAVLVILGDDLSGLNRRAIIDGKPLKNYLRQNKLQKFIINFLGVTAVQRSDGSFSASIEGNEFDMRFVYCACCICYMLNDWGGVNKKAMGNYIMQSIVSLEAFVSFAD